MPKNKSAKPGKKTKKRSLLTKIRKVVVSIFAITVLWVFLYRFIDPPVTLLMIERAIGRKMDGKDWKLEKEWRDFDELSDNLKNAAISGEDVHFRQHWGFDLQAIQVAYEKNKKGGRIRGGSTITQQVAKNVFLWPGRSYIRKGFEAYFTVLIELLWSKERIMEVYLNVIEMGDGIYGAEAATQYYYHKPSTSLTRREAALLISILPNPRKWTPLHPNRYVQLKTRRILLNMQKIKKLKWNF